MPETIEKEISEEIFPQMVSLLYLVLVILSQMGIHADEEQITWSHNSPPFLQAINGRSPVIVTKDGPQGQE